MGRLTGLHNKKDYRLVRKYFIIILFSALLAFVQSVIFLLHHQLVTGLNPFSGVIVTTLLLTIVVFVCRRFIKTFKKYISFTPDILFTIGSICYLMLICLRQILYGNSALDIQLHDSYSVVTYSFPLIYATIGFAIFAGIYHLFSEIFKRQMNNTLGYAHFWITFLCTSFLIFPMQYVHLTGMPRRYYDYSSSGDHRLFDEPNTFIITTECLLITAQLLFLYNLLNSIFRKEG